MNRGNIKINPGSDNELNISLSLSEDGTVWMTIEEIAYLFNVMASAVNRHIKEIITSGELYEEQVKLVLHKDFPDMGNYQVECYNLDMIVALSFRIKSYPCLLFRRWIREQIGKSVLA